MAGMFTRETRFGMIATLCTLTAFALSSNAIPPLVTTIARDFRVDYTTFGGYVALLQYSCFALASVLGGWAAHRFGLTHRALIIVGILLLGMLLIGGSQFDRFKWFILWALPLGFTGGLVETFSSIMLCRFGGPQSSKMCSLGQVFFCFGAIFAPSLVAVLLGAGLSWRASFVSLGGLIFLLGVWFIIQTRALVEPAWETPVEPRGRTPVGSDPPSLRSDPLLYLLAGASFLYVAVESSIIVWVASYFETHLEVTVQDATWRLSLYWTGMLIGRVLILFLHGSWTLWPAVLVAGVGMMLCNALLIVKWSAPVATGWIFLGGLLAGPLWPVIVSISQRVRNSSPFTSCVIGAGALGAALGPFASSGIIRHLGMGALFPVLTVGGLALVACILKARTYDVDLPSQSH